MKLISLFLLLCLVATAAACSPAGLQTTGIAGTAVSGTVEPVIVTQLPPGYTPPPFEPPPASTAIPPLPGELSPTELKYRILTEFPELFFCDPDFYPVAREDELSLAQKRFPELQANPEEFSAILEHNGLAGQTTFTDEQKLLSYREHKRLAAVPLTLNGDVYQFQIQVAKTEGEGELVSGKIDAQGYIAVEKREPSFATCPICLTAGTLIDTPSGPIPVQDLAAGTPVWTLSKSGERVVNPVLVESRTFVPATHQVIHLLLEDGRELRVSPLHPTTDGGAIEDLSLGEYLDGATIVSAEREPYASPATYDLLPAGDTGFYWADGVLLASTLIIREER